MKNIKYMEHQSETKNCQNCKKDFIIEPEDFLFYEKIKVPPPTFCPECRLVRRLFWRNVRSLYKRECGLCNKVLVCMYEDDGVDVYCLECFNSDNWDQFKYAKDINWGENIFVQINNIFRKQPRQYRYLVGTIINSDYCNSIANSKNAYLCFSVIDCEDVMYSENIDKSKNSLDCFSVSALDQCYWNIISNNNYNSNFCHSSSSCIDSSFLFDCSNCSNCCMSWNLRNKQYYFLNKKYSKDEYFEKVSNLKLETNDGLSKAKEIFKDVYKKGIHRYSHNISSENVLGDFVNNSKNIYKSFDVSDNSENIRYSNRVINSKDMMDIFAVITGELSYECIAPSGGSYRQIGCSFCMNSKNMEYSLFCKNCSDCFGCVGIKGSSYCIFNKQYTKEEYKEIVPKLRQHMIDHPYVGKNNRVYSYGDFHPIELSVFGYNETVNLDYFPISYEESLFMGYPWKIREKRDYNITIKSEELPNSIKDINENILNEIIGCSNEGNSSFQCTTAYKITKEELGFYIQKGLPIPRICPNCRHYERLKYRNPVKLWHRTCMKEGCTNEFETTYSPDRPEIVYCKQCYQEEVL
jgi:hypothetical protein